MPQKAAFIMMINELHVSTNKTSSKEEITARVCLVREGRAGTTPNWECFLIGDNTPQSVLLMDAWGKHIATAKRECKEGTVCDITNYVLIPKGKSTPFGNNADKISVTEKIRITPAKGAYPQIPKALPLANIAAALELKAPMIVSLLLRAHKVGHLEQTGTEHNGD